jgi:hypothetical protein
VASGDVNGDGRRDFVLGAIGTACRNGGLPKVCEGDAGAAYVVFGQATPANVDLANLGDGGFRMNGAAGDSKAGWAVAAGDYTGDGKDDVAVSAIWANNYSGATYVVKGKTSAGMPLKGLIRVGTRVVDDSVEIAISDSGNGIPVEVRSRIFDPFFTTKEVGKGTGQGLAIARSVVVDKHGGTLHFETELGQGTTFYIRLPIDGPKAAGSENASAAA